MKYLGRICVLLLFFTGIFFIISRTVGGNLKANLLQKYTKGKSEINTKTKLVEEYKNDTTLYSKLTLHLVHNKPNAKWPVKTPPPLPGSILPFKRIVSYYGNFYSKRMGILGLKPTDTMLVRLKAEVAKWQKADTLINVIPALHYIAVTAQGEPGKNKKYRLRMPDSQIEKAITLAKKIDALVILDIQTGQSTVKEEIPRLEKYLKLPNVHLALDPEYYLSSSIPGKRIGSIDASDVNYASSFLATLVKKNKLSPKVLIVHRFTKGMVTNYKKIKKQPEVQIVINMDGFGSPAKKLNSYKLAVLHEPVQYSGFKVFYKNDKKTSPYRIMQPKDILKLYPKPIYIQYQ